VADIDNPGILVTDPLRLFRSADLVDLSLGDDGSGRRVSWPGLGVDRQRNQNRRGKQNSPCSVLHSVPPQYSGIRKRLARSSTRVNRYVDGPDCDVTLPSAMSCEPGKSRCRDSSVTAAIAIAALLMVSHATRDLRRPRRVRYSLHSDGLPSRRHTPSNG